jgi:hypothetical protein
MSGWWSIFRRDAAGRLMRRGQRVLAWLICPNEWAVWLDLRDPGIRRRKRA